MKRTLAISLVLLLFLSFRTSDVGLGPVEVNASNGYPVHNLDTGLNYTSIQEAIDALQTLDGHRILVEKGVYFENVIIGKSISLLGENKSNTIIDGNNVGTVLDVRADYVNVSGLTVQRSGIFPNAGIFICYNPNLPPPETWSIHTNISNNILKWNSYGILLRFSSYNSISGNVFVDNSAGIMLENASYNAILGNVMHA